MKTVVVSPKESNRAWLVVDASDTTLGRLASAVAQLLMGKGKAAFSPHQDHGDNVIVVNAEKLRLSGKKFAQKNYFHHTPYPGGSKFRTAREQMDRDPTKVIVHAVRGMVPHDGPLGINMLKKLHVYAGETHPHTAQKPLVHSLRRNQG
jgi:large subunit ribosomal protein L13